MSDEEDKMEKKTGKESKVIWMLKALLASYIVTGLLLLLMALLLYKMDLNEQMVTVGIIVTYIVSTFVGGLILGKLTRVKKFMWGLALGVTYFALLLLISLGVYRTLGSGAVNVATTLLMCAGGGMIGGMVS